MDHHSSLFASETYNILGSGKKQDKIDKINKNIAHTGYVVDKDKSNRSIIYFKNDAEKKATIAHRGTSVKHKEDIQSDMHLAFGKDSKDLSKRRRRTEKLVKATPHDYEITLTGHSLGGHSAMDSAVKSKNVRDRVKHIHTYNGAFSPFTKNPGKKVKADLDAKTTHHRVAGDLVSISHPIAPTIGVVKEYKPKIKNKYKSIPKSLRGVFNNLDQLNLHTINNFLP